MLSGAAAAFQVTTSATFVEAVPDRARAQAFGLAASGLIAVQGIGIALGGLLAEAVGSAAYAVAIVGAAGTVVALLAARAWERARAAASQDTDDPVGNR